MRILSFDQATVISGWAVFQDGNYVDSGIITRPKAEKIDIRTKNMGLELCKKIEEVKPDFLVIEEVQDQHNISTVIKLARLQGILLGFAAAHNIQTEILTPSSWRGVLAYRQGPGVKREELKQQSIDYVKKNFGFDFSEDRCEAVCIGAAACKKFEKSDDIDIEI